MLFVGKFATKEIFIKFFKFLFRNTLLIEKRIANKIKFKWKIDC